MRKTSYMKLRQRERRKNLREQPQQQQNKNQHLGTFRLYNSRGPTDYVAERKKLTRKQQELIDRLRASEATSMYGPDPN